MPILILGLGALAAFLVIGGLLFAAGISERRQSSGGLEQPASPRKAA